MKTLLTRSISGIIFVSLVVFCLLADEKFMLALFGLISAIGLYEYHLLFSSQKRFNYPTIISSVFGALCFLLMMQPLVYENQSGLDGINHAILHLTITILVFCVFQLIYKRKELLSNMLFLLSGIIYIVIPLCMGAILHWQDQGVFPILLGLFLLVWTNDTFAYICGNLFGKHKLIISISPNKTWEGSIGGFLFTVLAGFLIDTYLLHGDYFWTIAAILVSPAAVIGDLFESALKRKNNVKDTGNIMPGHGGILDRFDAMFFAIPFFYIWHVIYTFI